MGFCDNVSSDEVLNADQSLIFPEKDYVKFTCIDAKENAKNGDLILDCQVNSGQYTGQRHSIFISDNENPIAKKKKAQFLKAFWTMDQLKSGNISPADLIAKEFKCKAEKARTVDSGMTFQGFSMFEVIDGSGTDNPIATGPGTVDGAVTQSAQAPLITPEGGIA